MHLLGWKPLNFVNRSRVACYLDHQRNIFSPHPNLERSMRMLAKDAKFDDVDGYPGIYVFVFSLEHKP